MDGGTVEDHEMFRNIVEISPDIVFRTNRRGVFTYVSPAAEESLGYEPGELVGTSFETYTHDDDFEEATGAFGRVLEGETVRGLEVRFRREGSDYAHIEVNAVPVSEGGDIVEVQGITRDITEQKERERELEVYERMLNTVPDVVYALDEEGKLIAGNGVAAELTGYEEIDTIAQVVDEKDIQRGREMVREMMETDRDRGMLELDLVTKDGDRIPCENHVALRYEDGEFAGTVGVLRDVSDGKERERELRRQNQRLEEFASMVSHDLRGPLNVATGRIELARETGDIDHLDGAEGALGRMDALIEQVLELARKGRTVGEGEQTDLRELAEDAWDSTETGDATLELGELEAVEADGVRLREVFENLFRNSVEHGSTSGRTGSDDSVEHGGPVTVRVGALEDGFYVEDDGTGMSEDERDDVFEYGYSTTEEGSGIGLAVVKNVVEAHGWEIDVTESEEGGARFEVTGT
jgi:PAS domain S-box-containing protein